MRHDIGQIARMLASRAEDVCRWLLPTGKRQGQEWCCGNTSGDAGDSLRVNIGGKPGVWRDFAADEKGGDLVDLIMACRNCSKAEAAKDAREFLGLKDDAPEFMPKRREYTRPEKPACIVPKSAVAGFFAGRGLTPETVKAFKIGEKDGKVIVFPYFHGDTLKFIKFRPVDNKSGMWTAKDAEPILFGWQAITQSTRHIVLTEGEIDAMSFSQQGQPALSVPRGGGDGNKQDEWIACEWENLQLFDTIYLAMDMDEQGQKAAQHIAQRLGRHRCKLVDFGKYKDANEALMDGARLVSFLFSASPCDPPELRSASSYVDEVIAFFAGKEDATGYTLPWYKTNRQVRIRPAEISVWAGINGHGKSQVAGHILVGSLPQRQRWCVASMEFKPVTLLSRLYRQASAVSQPDPDLCRGPLRNFFDGNLFLFDVQGTAKGDRILEVFDYAFRRYGCTSFLVDSLAKCGFGEDDYNGQKAFVDRLMEFAQRNNVHVHLVCHARKGKSEDDAPEKMDVKGTGALTDMVDNVFTVWRNKPKERAKEEFARTRAPKKELNAPDCLIECCKQRNGEWEGKIGLWFDPASLQYLEGEAYGNYTYLPATSQGDKTAPSWHDNDL